MVRSPVDKTLAIIFSVGIHVILLGVIVFSLEWGPVREFSAPKVNPIQAVVVDESKVKAEMNRLKEEEARKKRAEEKRVKRLEERAKKAKANRKKEQKRLSQIQKKRKQEKSKAAREKKAEQQRLDKIKKEKAALTKTRREEEKRLAVVKAQKQRELEKKRKAEAERKRVEEEKRRAEEKRLAERDLQKQLAAEQPALDRRRQAVQDRRRDEYTASIHDKVKRNWRVPIGVPSNLKCTVRVEQIPGGEVIRVVVTKSSGNVAFDRSVENAVYRSTPLPKPKDPAIFDRVILFTFDPED
ncbi:MAG: cell envelope integrity protein TolA [Gammaproteobacteria bacterium]|nr:MAG: cell envelope integrity protein TolA [Gammaproteobacteria bacterium]